MAKLSRKKGIVSQILHIFIQDASSTTGAGLTGLVYNTASLACRYINAGGTLSGAITLQDITTLGTYEAPTANTNMRFKEVSSASPSQGVYELHLHNDWLNLTGGSLVIMLAGATNMAQTRLEIDLQADANVTHWLGTACATPTVAGVPEVDMTHMGGDAQSATDLKDFADAGYDPATNKVEGVKLVDTLTTHTGNTPQTGDGYAVLTNGTYGLSAIENLVDGLETTIGAAGAGLTALGDTRIAYLDAAVSGRMATYTQPTGFLAATFPSDPADQSLIIAATDAIKADTAAILFDTIEIGVAGSGLTAIPWNAAWDAEVQSECADALDDTYGDATGLTADGTKDRLRTMGWVLKNKMAVTNANGNTTIYKDNSTTPAFTVAGCLTDDSTTITRLRLA